MIDCELYNPLACPSSTSTDTDLCFSILLQGNVFKNFNFQKLQSVYTPKVSVDFRIFGQVLSLTSFQGLITVINN